MLLLAERKFRRINSPELLPAVAAGQQYRDGQTPAAHRHADDIGNYEGFYASVFCSYFAALGYEIAVEESNSHGRLDMAVRAGGHVYLFEFKVAEMSALGSALRQLQERGYADKYRARGHPIHLIGVEFSRESRNITAIEALAG